jgi:RNA 3'-terminal phosphate cyclase (ATP)
LPRHIAERERDTLLAKLNWAPHCIRTEQVEALGPGNFVCLEVESEHVTEVFSSFGRQGVKAEHVAEQAVRQARDYLRTDAPVGPYLADQLMLPLGLSAAAGPAAGPRGGRFRTLPLTRHSQTHLDLLPKFLEIAVRVDRSDDGQTCVVALAPRAAAPSVA